MHKSLNQSCLDVAQENHSYFREVLQFVFFFLSTVMNVDVGDIANNH